MTREEALKIVRENYPHFGTTEPWLDLEKALATLIPELAESEDERIRKALVWHLKADVDFVSNGVTKAECLAYLEKQKEQKPVEKPINWTELTWKDIVELEGIINNVHYEFRNGIGQESFGKEVLEKFREYKGDEYLDEIEQKPAEWSEEDEEILKLLILNIGRYKYFGGMSSERVLAFLKSLRPQPHWKPSEEQMKALSDACCIAFEEERDFRDDLQLD